MHSMTGFGSAVCAADGVTVEVQISAVNRKNAEMRLHMPRELSFLEPAVRGWIRDAVTRGYFTVNANCEMTGESAHRLVVDKGLVKALQSELADLGELGVKGDLTVADLLQVPDLVRVEAVAVPEVVLSELAERAVAEALTKLTAMRRREGEALHADLSARSERLQALHGKILPLAAASVAQFRDRLAERIQLLLEEVTLDDERLGRETAIYADRSDVSEELTRIASHLNQLTELMASPDPVGRRLEFVTQELVREINTVGSKTICAEISALVVEFKSELDRLREQVMNVE